MFNLNMIKGTPILKLATVKRLKVKLKSTQKSNFVKIFVKKIRQKNSSSKKFFIEKILRRKNLSKKNSSKKSIKKISSKNSPKNSYHRYGELKPLKTLKKT